jgi:ubiquinone/menaquinone biosynthesis C-methylase UbiE
MATRNVKPATLHLVDAAPGMVAIARDKFEGQQPNLNIHCATMPAERLDFPDESFTHSITNLGILFFTDADQGAKEIFRTLKPGGTAVVTSWQDLGYLPLLHQAQQAVRPDALLINLPIKDVWFRPEHVREVLERAGFGEVEVSAARVHYAGERAGDVSSLLSTQARSSLQDWSEEELGRFKDALDGLIEAAAEKFEKPDGSVAVGIPMVAIVAVCRK